MTVEEALAEIERLGGGPAMPPLAQQEIPCRDTQQAVRLLAEAYGNLRKRDPLSGVYSKAGKDTCKYSCFMRFRRAAAYYPRWVLQSCSSPSDSARAC